MESKKGSDKKKKNVHRTSKKKQTLFKTKKIKPKIKLDPRKVLWFCVIISIACIFLLILAIYIPGTDLATNSKVDDSAKLFESDKKELPVSPNSQVEKEQDSKQQTQKAENFKSILESEQNNTNIKEEQPIKSEKKEQHQNSENEKEREKQKEEQHQKQKLENTQNQKESPLLFDFPQAVNAAQIVFLFDDGGQNLEQLDKFLKLPFPITIAVLPKLAHSAESAKKIRESGNELMLHQPMQAINLAVNPGPGAIKPEMTDSEIISTIFQNIEEIGPVVGMNNHEGSAITADAHKMEVILKYANENEMFFLDSRTNKDTQVPFVSHELGYPYYERNGNFLDNVKTRENALTEIRKNLDRANRDGVVIMIGHIWSADWLVQLLLDIYPELKSKGYVFTTVSKCRGKK